MDKKTENTLGLFDQESGADAQSQAPAATGRRASGRPKAETPKVHVGFRLAADVVEGIKQTGKGYNARVEDVLREALAAGKLNAPRDLLGV